MNYDTLQYYIVVSYHYKYIYIYHHIILYIILYNVHQIYTITIEHDDVPCEICWGPHGPR